MSWRLFITLTAIAGTILCYLLIQTIQDTEKITERFQATETGYQVLNDGRGYRL